LCVIEFGRCVTLCPPARRHLSLIPAAWTRAVRRFLRDVSQIRTPSQHRRLEGRQAPTTCRHGTARPRCSALSAVARCRFF